MAPSVGFLKSLPYLAILSAKEFERVKKAALELSFAHGEIIFLEGEPSRGLYVVKSGQVRIFKTSPEGREQVLLIAQPGDSFNDVAVFDGEPNPASSSALEAATIYLIPRETVLSLVAGCPVALEIIKLLARRLRHLATVVESLSFGTVLSRLAKLLLDLAVREEGTAPIPRLTQEEMAAMVGSVRDVIGRALRTLERTGAVKIDSHRILVVDPEKLREMI